jgi:hypothetical protein
MTLSTGRLRVLDLFAGLRGWSDPWRERGHDTFTVDIDPRFDVDLHADVLELTPDALPWKPDVVLASPPCECFSVMTFGRYWNHDRTPRLPKAAVAWALVSNTLDLITELGPAFWVMENPRAMLRKLMPGPLEAQFQRVTVTYCQYGENVRKPTDLWGIFPPSWAPKAMCLNGARCHVRAPRGSHSGTQGIGRSRSNLDFESKAERARIPRELSLSLCLAAEHDFVAASPSTGEGNE